MDFVCEGFRTSPFRRPWSDVHRSEGRAASKIAVAGKRDEGLARHAASTCRPPRRGHSLCARALASLTRFLDDGRIELDNNPVERAIRPVALGRKNHLFKDSDGGGVRWATVCSLIATAKLNNVEPFAWLRDVLQRMTEGHPASRLDELLPWNWQPTTAKA
jgi:hypothetical protein